MLRTRNDICLANRYRRFWISFIPFCLFRESPLISYVILIFSIVWIAVSVSVLCPDCIQCCILCNLECTIQNSSVSFTFSTGNQICFGFAPAKEYRVISYKISLLCNCYFRIDGILRTFRYSSFTAICVISQCNVLNGRCGNVNSRGSYILVLNGTIWIFIGQCCARICRNAITRSIFLGYHLKGYLFFLFCDVANIPCYLVLFIIKCQTGNILITHQCEALRNTIYQFCFCTGIHCINILCPFFQNFFQFFCVICIIYIFIMV